MLVVERRILARLRTFFSLGDMNNAIHELIEHLNTRPFKKIDGNRGSRFKDGERSTLKALPTRAYEFGEWRKAKAHPDYRYRVTPGWHQPERWTRISGKRGPPSPEYARRRCRRAARRPIAVPFRAAALGRSWGMRGRRLLEFADSRNGQF